MVHTVRSIQYFSGCGLWLLHQTFPMQNKLKAIKLFLKSLECRTCDQIYVAIKACASQGRRSTDTKLQSGIVPSRAGASLEMRPCAGRICGNRVNTRWLWWLTRLLSANIICPPTVWPCFLPQLWRGFSVSLGKYVGEAGGRAGNRCSIPIFKA